MDMIVALEIYLGGSFLMAVPFGRYLRRAGGRRAEQIIGAAVASLTWPFALPMLARSAARTRSERAEVRQLHPAGSDLEERFRVASAR
jgi:hypothetical protein